MKTLNRRKFGIILCYALILSVIIQQIIVNAVCGGEGLFYTLVNMLATTAVFAAVTVAQALLYRKKGESFAAGALSVSVTVIKCVGCFVVGFAIQALCANFPRGNYYAYALVVMWWFLFPAAAVSEVLFAAERAKRTV